VCFWANLKLNSKNEDEPAVKPFNKRKGRTIKPEASVSNPLEQDNDTFGKIDEFNSDTWSVKTNDWIKGALYKGFDSMAIMQPLVNEAQQTGEAIYTAIALKLLSLLPLDHHRSPDAPLLREWFQILMTATTIINNVREAALFVSQCFKRYCMA
jgi:hypothetical protein